LPSDQCQRNCSFPSGHAALGFFFVAIGFVVGRHRGRWMRAGVALGTMLGCVRIVQGGHFLSDVVFAFCFVFVTAWVLHALLYKAEPSR
jgi:lipid A 4'-phosphatase